MPNKTTRTRRKKNLISNAERVLLIRRTQEGDHKAFEKYLAINRGLLELLLNYYIKWFPECDIEDLRQEASLGVYIGIMKYDTSKEAKSGKPEGYVFSWARAQINKHLDYLSRNKTTTFPAMEDYTGKREMWHENMPDKALTPEESICTSSAIKWVRDQASIMGPRQTVITDQRLLQAKRPTLEAVGNKLGLSRERIRQLEIDIRVYLKEKAIQEGLEWT